jgi:hypothetical protein
MLAPAIVEAILDGCQPPRSVDPASQHAETFALCRTETPPRLALTVR